MEVFDMLVLGVEAAFALAGFAGIIATFQFGDAKKIRRLDAVGLSLIVKDSFSAAALCTLPMLLIVFQTNESTTWFLASLFAVIVLSYSMYGGYRLSRRAFKSKTFLLLFLLVLIVTSLIVFANILNAAGIVFNRKPGPVLMGAVWGLAIAAYSFTRLLLLPIWKTVRLMEAADAGASA
ncbi:MAG: hypothetical protein KJO95_09310 [Gammaproteobacteria bacterium]|nr:hypothetical protein [Gammaproteobacteria bacterium]MBU2677705.1 hypothetical protein [Gammaproteobacteria bacterium]NNL51438.1 hypothetical protein [Woeseiaceae bacterium]